MMDTNRALINQPACALEQQTGNSSLTSSFVFVDVNNYLFIHFYLFIYLLTKHYIKCIAMYKESRTTRHR